MLAHEIRKKLLQATYLRVEKEVISVRSQLSTLPAMAALIDQVPSTIAMTSIRISLAVANEVDP